MKIEEIRQLKRGDRIVVDVEAWDGLVHRPASPLTCTVTYLNGTAYDATQVHVFPLNPKIPCQPKYVFPSQVLRKVGHEEETS